MLGYAGTVNLREGVMAKTPKIIHKPCKPQAARDISEMSPSYTLDGPLERARWEVWKWNFHYLQLRLRAATKGEISPERDAKVGAAYASRSTVRKCRNSQAIIASACAEIEKYASVKLDSAGAEKALELIHGPMKPAPKPKPVKAQSYKARLAEAREFARKGFSISFDSDGVWVMITPDNYKQPVSKLVDKRLAEIAAYEAKFADLGKCKCASHTDILGHGEFSKARKQRKS